MKRALRALNRVGLRVGDWVLDHTPRIVITDTYQVMFAFALLGMGLVTLLALILPGSSGAISHTLPDPLRYLWASSMVLGGVGQMAGLQWYSRDLERGGIALSGLGCLIYAIALGGFSQTLSGVALCFVFSCLAGGYLLRLFVSSRAKRIQKAVGT